VPELSAGIAAHGLSVVIVALGGGAVRGWRPLRVSWRL